MESSDQGMYICSINDGPSKNEKTNKLIVAEAPKPVTGLNTREVWSRSASLYWNPLTDVTGYVLHYWVESHTGSNKRLEKVQLTSSQTSFLLQGLEPGSTYGISVSGVNEVGPGNPSATLKFKTGEEEPSAPPMDVRATAQGPSTICVSWRPPIREKWNGNLVGFYVGFKQTSELDRPYQIRTVPYGAFNHTYEYFLTGLSRGTEYVVTVRAYNLVGSGPEFDAQIVRTASTELPGAPRLSIAAVTPNSLSLHWTMPDSSQKIIGYILSYRPDSSPTWIKMPLAAASNEFVLQSLMPSSLYHVYLVASSTGGDGDPSPILTIKTKGTVDDHVFPGHFSPNMHQSFIPGLSREQEAFISLTVAAVVVIIAIITSYVCITKAKLQVPPPPFDDKGGVYVETMRRYMEVDASGRPVMAGNPAAIAMYPTSYSALPVTPGRK